MAVNKLVDSTQLDACCTAEANAIRAKTGGSAQIAYDWANSKGFADAIDDIDITPQTITGDGWQITTISSKDYLETTGGSTPNLQTKTDIHPSASSQTIQADGGYDGLASVQINAVTLTNLSAGNIKKDVVVKIGDSADDDCVASVTGTYAGGGITVVDCIERKVTGDVVLNITNAPPGDWYDCYGGLFRDNKISSLTVKGLLHCPMRIADQQNVGTNGNQSVLTSVSFPDAVYGGQRAFIYAKALVSASLPSLAYTYYNYSSLGDYMFGYCSSLTTVDLGNVNRICTYMFRDCTSLSFLELKAVDNIQANAFSGASSLGTIVIRSNAVPTLANISAFTNTKFASGKAGGTLYVPQNLISSYQSASNWSTILGYATNSIVAIEGSAYDT